MSTKNRLDRVNRWRLLSIGGFCLVLLSGLLGGLLLANGEIRRPFDLSVIMFCSGIAWWVTEQAAQLGQ